MKERSPHRIFNDMCVLAIDDDPRSVFHVDHLRLSEILFGQVVALPRYRAGLNIPCLASRETDDLRTGPVDLGGILLEGVGAIDALDVGELLVLAIPSDGVKGAGF